MLINGFHPKMTPKLSQGMLDLVCDACDAWSRTGGTGPGNGAEPEKPDRVVRTEPAEPDRHPAQPNRTEPNRTHAAFKDFNPKIRWPNHNPNANREQLRL